MHRSFPNVTPVANKYLEHQKFLKVQAEHERNIKNAHGVVNATAPIPRPHCTQRLRQKQMREHELAVIDQENQRMRARMSKSGATVDSHNSYVLHSLNTKKRALQQADHEMTVQRLQKLLVTARTSYPKQEFEEDFARKKDIQHRMSRFYIGKK